MNHYKVIAFANTHTAMTAQKLLKDKVSFAVMPTPRVISSGCGISIRLAPQDGDAALLLLTEAQLPDTFYKMHEIEL